MSRQYQKQKDKWIKIGYEKGIKETEKWVEGLIETYDVALKKERKRIDEDIGTPDFEVLKDMEVEAMENLVTQLKKQISGEKNG